MKIRTIKEAWEFVRLQFGNILDSGEEIQTQIPFNIIVDTFEFLKWTYKPTLGKDGQYNIVFKNDKGITYYLFGSLLSNEIMIQKVNAEI